MISLRSRCVALALILSATTAFAGQMSPDIAAKVEELGAVIDPPRTGAIYAPLQHKEPYQGVRVERDVKYGPADRNLLDTFVTEAASTGLRPVLIFVHGGGFVTGDKHKPGTPFYDNLMLWAVKEGFVGVNMTYRLAPQAPWPAGVEDVARVIRWTTDNIAALGGDPARIYLMGHSAGAAHVAAYVAHGEFHGPKGDGLAGAILASGIYDLTLVPPSDRELAYYGTDMTVYKERSSLDGLVASKTPLLIVRAELDPFPFVKNFDALKDQLCSSARGCARALVLPQHSHMSEIYAVNSDDTVLTDEMRAFMKAGK